MSKHSHMIETAYGLQYSVADVLMEILEDRKLTSHPKYHPGAVPYLQKIISTAPYAGGEKSPFNSMAERIDTFSDDHINREIALRALGDCVLFTLGFFPASFLKVRHESPSLDYIAEIGGRAYRHASYASSKKEVRKLMGHVAEFFTAYAGTLWEVKQTMRVEQPIIDDLIDDPETSERIQAMITDMSLDIERSPEFLQKLAKVFGDRVYRFDQTKKHDQHQAHILN